MVEGTAGRRRIGLIALIAAAAALCIALGAATGVLVPRLNRPGDDSIDAGFARDMSTHHSQAVEMGMIAYRSATDPDVRTLGGDIALTQQSQIGTMDAWLQEWHLDPTGAQPAMAWMPGGAAAVKDGLMPGMADPQEMAALRDAKGKDVDLQFLKLIQRHHLGGIHMAEHAAKHASEKHVADFAQGMANTQQSEMGFIQQLLNKLGTGS